MADQDETIKKLQEISTLEGNDSCCDCGERDPKQLGWASHNLGIFFCIQCSAFHRRMGVDYSKVKSTQMDSWTEELVNFMSKNGNNKSKEIYEYYVPEGTLKPSCGSVDLIKEQWIRAKYENKKFTKEAQETYNATQIWVKSKGESGTEPSLKLPVNSGMLYKLGLKRKNYKLRYFSLTDKFLFYFREANSPRPLGRIILGECSVSLIDQEDIPKEMSGKFGFHLFTLERNYYFYSENAQEVWQWMNSLREIKLVLQHFAAGTDSNEETLNPNITKQGPLSKLGGKVTKKWQTRHCSLSHNTLAYYKNTKDQTPAGTINLTDAEIVSSTVEGKEHTFLIKTPTRIYTFSAPSMLEMDNWVSTLQQKTEQNNLLENDDKEIKTGYLVKEGGPGNVATKPFKRPMKRWFVLTPNKLAYQKEKCSTTPIDVIHLEHATVFLSIEEDNFYERKKQTFEMHLYTPSRSYYMTATSEEELISWGENIIKSKQSPEISRLEIASKNPDAPSNNNFNKEGVLSKEKKDGEFVESRFAIVDNIYYFKNPKDEKPTGIIFLADSLAVQIEDKSKNNLFCFKITTSYKDYFLYANTKEDMKDWLLQIRQAKKTFFGISNSV